MAQQKSEDRIVPQGGVTPVSTRRVEPRGGGKAVPVDEEVEQLRLPIATAENPQGAVRARTKDRSLTTSPRVPKAMWHVEKSLPVTMEPHRRLCPAHAGVEMSRGREPAGGGVNNPHPEEPYTTSVRTVLWEPGAGNCPRLPDIWAGDPQQSSRAWCVAHAPDSSLSFGRTRKKNA